MSSIEIIRLSTWVSSVSRLNSFLSFLPECSLRVACVFFVGVFSCVSPGSRKTSRIIPEECLSMISCKLLARSCLSVSIRSVQRVTTRCRTSTYGRAWNTVEMFGIQGWAFSACTPMLDHVSILANCFRSKCLTVVC